MSTDPATLGGRLPLLDPESLAPAQKKLFDQMIEVVPGLVELEVAVPRSRPAVW
jgi:hypothetical protein